MPKVIKPEQSIYECLLLGFCFNNIFSLRHHKFWLHRQLSSAQFQKRRMMGDGFLCVTAAGHFEQ